MSKEMTTKTKKESVIEYKPLGESSAIELTIPRVKRYLSVKTRSGKEPSDEEVVKFMMLCQSRQLNPWDGDAYLVGYDANDGPTFSLITAIQSLLKRAEVSPEFDGIESGVVLEYPDGEILNRPGSIVPKKAVLIGGWAIVYRKDLSHPIVAELQLATFSTGRSRWKIDPAGMICKCAKAAALRDAFPTQVGGLMIRDEMDRTIDGTVIQPEAPSKTRPKDLAQLTNRMTPTNGSVVQDADNPTDAELNSAFQLGVDQFNDGRSVADPGTLTGKLADVVRQGFRNEKQDAEALQQALDDQTPRGESDEGIDPDPVEQPSEDLAQDAWLQVDVPELFGMAKTLKACDELYGELISDHREPRTEWQERVKSAVALVCNKRKDEIRATRGGRSGSQKDLI